MEQSYVNRAFDIENEAESISCDADKALTLIDDLVDDFFGRTDVSPKGLKTVCSLENNYELNNNAIVLSDYNRFSNYAFILFDYIHKIKQDMDRLTEESSSFRIDLSKEKTAQASAKAQAE